MHQILLSVMEFKILWHNHNNSNHIFNSLMILVTSTFGNDRFWIMNHPVGVDSIIHVFCLFLANFEKLRSGARLSYMMKLI